MKKKKVMGLLGLMSCAALITSCSLPAPLQTAVDWANKNIISPIADLFNGGSKKEEKKDEDKPTPTPSPEPEKSISVKELPEQVFVGDTLDLDSYVELQNVSSYTVELASGSSELATLDGHVLTFTGEGDVAFTVKAGELSEKCSVSALSSVREYLFEEFSKSGTRYTILDLGFDEETKSYYVSDYYIHNSNYVLTRYFDQDSEGNVLPGGWCSFTGEDTYSFMIASDDEGNESITGLTVAQSIYMQVFNPAVDADYYFSLSEGNSVYEYDAENDEEMIVITGETAVWWAQETMLTYQGEFKGYQLDEDGNRIVESVDEETGEVTYKTTYYVYDRVEFIVDAEEDEEGNVEKTIYYNAYVYDESDESKTLLPNNFGVIYLGEDAGDELLDAYVVPENKPQEIDYFRDYFSVSLDKLMLSDECVLGSTGSYSANFSWLTLTGEEADTTASDFEAALWGWAPYFETSANMVLGNGTSVWELDSSTNEVVKGELLVAGEEGSTVWYALPDDSEAGYFVEDTDHKSPWDASFSFAGLRDQSIYSSDCILSVDVSVYDTIPAEEEGGEATEIYAYIFNFNADKQAPVINAMLDALKLSEVKDLEDNLNSASGDGVFENELCELTITAIPSYGYVIFTLDISYASGWPYVYEVQLISSVNPGYASYVSSLEAAVAPLCVVE